MVSDRIWAEVCRDEIIDYYLVSTPWFQNFNYYPLTMLKYPFSMVISAKGPQIKFLKPWLDWNLNSK